jgi:hypothetical protein
MRKLSIAKHHSVALPGDVQGCFDFQLRADRVPSEHARRDRRSFIQHGTGQLTGDRYRRPAEKQIRKMRHGFVLT